MIIVFNALAKKKKKKNSESSWPVREYHQHQANLVWMTVAMDGQGEGRSGE